MTAFIVFEVTDRAAFLQLYAFCITRVMFEFLLRRTKKVSYRFQLRSFVCLLTE